MAYFGADLLEFVLDDPVAGFGVVALDLDIDVAVVELGVVGVCVLDEALLLLVLRDHVVDHAAESADLVGGREVGLVLFELVEAQLELAGGDVDALEHLEDLRGLQLLAEGADLVFEVQLLAAEAGDGLGLLVVFELEVLLLGAQLLELLLDEDARVVGGDDVLLQAVELGELVLRDGLVRLELSGAAVQHTPAAADSAMRIEGTGLTYCIELVFSR